MRDHFRANHLGSTTFVTDQTGATIQKTIYYPWGQLWASSALIRDNRFASMDPRDAETGNDPTLFRLYNPRLYRWLSPDPLAGDISNPQSLNRYAYVLNNPTNLIDPLGLDGVIVMTPDEYPPNPDRQGGGAGDSFGNSGRVYAPVQDIGWVREPGGGCRDRTIFDVTHGFYEKYQDKLNDCIQKVFGAVAKWVGYQSYENSPSLDVSHTGRQLAEMSSGHYEQAYGSSAPFRGTYGTVYVSSELFSGTTPNTLNAIHATYAHELGNILDIRLYPGAPQGRYGSHFGNPNDTYDTDTGAALEKCIFGTYQFP